MKESNFFLIKQPVIKKMDFTGNNDFSFGNDSKVKLDIQIKKESSTKERKAQITLSLTLNNDCKIDEVPFILKSEIVGQFVWNEEATKEEIEHFINANAPSILLSYMRPVISNIVTYSGFPAFIIPFLDLRMG